MGTRTAVVTYFSGTGNTRHACSVLAAELERLEWHVRLREIAPPPGATADGSPDAVALDLVVFAFPVFGFSVPHLVRRCLRRLPKVRGTPAAVLAVFGDALAGPPAARRRVSGFEGGALDAAARMLGRRGYDVRTTRAVGFPFSFTQFAQPPGEDDRRILLEESEAAVAAVAADLDTGRHERRGRGAPTRAWTGLVGGLFSLVGRRVLGKLYICDDRCTSCGWCEKACPAATIRMSGTTAASRLPRWGWRCEACQRCINGCPEDAIQVSAVRLAAMAVAALPWGLLATRGWLHFPGAGLLGWLIGTLALTAAVDELLSLLERFPGIRRRLAMGYTRKFRRYRGPGTSLPDA